MDKIKIVIADDHVLFLKGITALLENSNNFDITHTVTNGVELLKVLKNVDVDVVILDISMPEMDGIEVCKILNKKFPDTKVLVLSTHSHIQLIYRLIKLGIKGYLLKNIEQEELFLAIENIHKGNTYFTKDIQGKQMENERKLRIKNDTVSELSRREKEILLLIVEENTTQDIADKMFISVNTVNTHRRNLLSKLQAKNTAGLVKYAYDAGLV